MLSDHTRFRLLDYIDGKLDSAERAELETALANNPELREEYRVLQELQAAGLDWQDQAVPHWGRLHGLNSVRRLPSNPAWPWLNWASLAASMAAVMLIVLQIQFTRTADGFTISFSGSSTVTMEQLLQDHLLALRIQQTSYVDQQILALEQKNAAVNRQLLSAALTYNRDERRRDMGELVRYWAESRSNDRVVMENLADRQIDGQLAIQHLYTRLPRREIQ